MIGSNYHRDAGLFHKLKLLLKCLNDLNQSCIENTEIFNIFKINKRLLLLLFETKVLQPDESILHLIMKGLDNQGYKLYYYLYSEIKNFIGKRKRKLIESKIAKKAKMIHIFVH